MKVIHSQIRAALNGVVEVQSIKEFNMITLLHYLPHVIFSGLVLLALALLFADDGRNKRTPARVRRQHFVWQEDDVRSAKRF